MGRKGQLFILLLWKNYLIQKRKVIITIFQVLIPSLFAVILILFRGRIVPRLEKDGQNWTDFSVNLLPDELHRQFHPKPHIAYTPDTAITRKLMDDVAGHLDVVTHGFYNETDMVTYLLYVNTTVNNSKIFLGGVIFHGDDMQREVLPKHVSYTIRLSALPRNAHILKNKTGAAMFAESSSWKTDLMFPMFAKMEPRQKYSNVGGNNPGGSRIHQEDEMANRIAQLETIPSVLETHTCEMEDTETQPRCLDALGPTEDKGYYEEGFLAIQHSLNLAIIRQAMRKNTKHDPSEIEVFLRRHPYPRYNNDGYVTVIQHQFPNIIMLSFILCTLSIIKDVTHEKERRLTESMKLMGISNWLHWSAWFVKYFLYLLIDVVLMTILYTSAISSNGKIISYTDPLIIFVFFMAYSVCIICYCFLISVFFNRANAAAAAGGVFYFAMYVPYYFIQPRYSKISLPVKLALCLWFNVAMPFGCQILGAFEGAGSGIQWNTINSGVSVDEDFSMLHVIIMLVVDSFIYLLIMWYVEAVWPGQYGIPRPWYFPLQRSYWCGVDHDVAENPEESLLLNENDDDDNVESFERDPIGLKAGIRIMKLTKMYKNQQISHPAVFKMSLNMYEGQITALLGHNGAGKTTTMSMLTGFIPPTSGTARVNGYDIVREITGVRQSIGLCPQHDILFDSLTVQEHLQFFALAKGYPRRKLSAEINQILEAVGLGHKRHCASKTLSGGMKRKLSIAIALIGDTKVVILDEPTSGMDASARHYIWNVLQRYRPGRTIVLSTHYMDEADLLGDRIAIMANGEVQCCGSSLFLKNKFGAGYHMTMVKTRGCDVNKITELITGYVTSARLASDVGLELTYILPHTATYRFEELFMEIDARRDELGVSSYGASVTTLEEVFLKVGEVTNGSLKEMINLPDKKSREGPSPSVRDYGTTSHPGSISRGNDDATFSTVSLQSVVAHHRINGLSLHFMQFYAMFIKGMLHSMRNVLLTASQLAIPVVFAVFALIVIKTFPGLSNSPPLELSVEKFDRSVIPYSHGLDASEEAVELSETYARVINRSYVRAVDVNNVTSYRTRPDLQDYLFYEGERSTSKYNRQYMVAAEFNTSASGNISATAFFNNQAYHSIAMTLNLLENAILRLFTNSSYKFDVTNYPLPLPKTAETSSSVNQLIGFSVAFDLLFGIAFMASSFTYFLIKERSVKAKHIQVVSGVNPINFWLATFAWDFLNFIIPCLLVIVFFAIFNMAAYTHWHAAHILLLFVLYGWAILPLMYLMSFLFTVPATGRVWITVFNILTGMVTMVIVAILKFPTFDLASIGKALEWVFIVLSPNFCLGDGLQNYYYNYEYNTLCSMMIPDLHKTCKIFVLFNITVPPCCLDSCTTYCFDFSYNYLSWHSLGIGRMLTFLALQGAFFFSILLLLESGLLQRVFYAFRSEKRAVIFQKQMSIDSRLKLDDDVAAEQERIATTTRARLFESGDTVVIHGLTKSYGDLVAVDSLSLGVSKGECFGLLGVNGAGKTTTFKMLTGDEIVTAGDAFLCGHSIRTQIKQVQKVLGYCPQYDALIEQMTGREMLFMFARLRGVPANERQVSVQQLIDSLLLTEHADKLVKHYSGGNKRKLSVAVALIGDPPIVFLDEPSTGMDPVARRLLWNTLSAVREQGRTLIFTSHSMEECEALCTRIGIMVNGQVRCLGSPQHLKSKFGAGYTLLAKIAYPESATEPDLQPIMSFIEATFSNCELHDIHEGMVHYQITDAQLSLAAIFGAMERAKEEYAIEDYSVSQTTLEQVFINFVRSQRPPTEVTNNSCSWCLCCRKPQTLHVMD